MKPLAEELRPKNLDEFIGQEHILASGKFLYNMIKNKNLVNLILFGPPGVGKTSFCEIIKNHFNLEFYKLNATVSSSTEIKDIVKKSKLNGFNKSIILYIDEIQNFNKKQQQALLEFVESGDIKLISSTTENPYHYIYPALLSRCFVFEFKELEFKDIEIGINKALKYISEKYIKFEFTKEAIDLVIKKSNGDLRKALNFVELIFLSNNLTLDEKILIDEKSILNSMNLKNKNMYKNIESHYDILSAFQKSIRGSDIDASLHYLARLILLNDLKSIVRRLLVIACEDIGLAYPNAITIVKSCTDAALQLGFPEARIPLSQAVVLLASSPKSNSALVAIDKALEDVQNSKTELQIPDFIRDAHYKGATSLNRGINYKYPHDFKNSYVYQEYLPKELLGKKYYNFGLNKMEIKMSDFLKGIKNQK